MSHLAEAVVDLDAIGYNTARMAAATSAQVMAVVKADGFGHGLLPVARATLAHGATWLGVTSSEEALALRAGGISAPILTWMHRVDGDFAALIRADVDIAVSSVQHLRAVAADAQRVGQVAQVQLKADTGLSRNGATAWDWPDLVAWARKCEVEGTIRVRGIWSHLTSADIPGSPSVPEQVALFRAALADAQAIGLDPTLRHLANSAAVLTLPDTHFDLVRPGVGLYGVEPIAGLDHGLRPALTLRTQVINVKRVPAGTGVSYQHTYATAVSTSLALVPVGYADGVPRSTGGKGMVWIAGRRHPIVGRVAMDQCVVDVGDAEVGIGDEVIVMGGGEGQPTAAEWAHWAETNPHEILTGIGARVVRRHVTRPMSTQGRRGSEVRGKA